MSEKLSDVTKKKKQEEILTDEEKLRRANLRRMAFLRRTCGVYTVFSILYFVICVLLFLPSQQQMTFASLLGGGMSIPGQGLLLGIGIVYAIVLAIVTRKKVPQKLTGLRKYFSDVPLWYTLFLVVLIVVYGFYFDTLFDSYVGTESALLKGPSFSMCLDSLGMAVVLPVLNLIYRTKLPTPIKAVLHLLSVTLAFALFFHILLDGFSSSSSYLIFTVFFAVAYGILSALYFLITGLQQRDENEASDYEQLYMTDEMRLARERSEQSSAKKRAKILYTGKKHLDQIDGDSPKGEGQS